MSTKNLRKALFRIAVLFVIALLVYGIPSYINSFKSFIATITPIIENPHATYQEKMEIKLPFYFDFIEKIKLLTPENAVIYIPLFNFPKGDPLGKIEQSNLTSALLYPRKVVFFQTKIPQNQGTRTYIVVIRGNPNEEIAAKKVYIIDQEIETVLGDYNPAVFDETTNGLIQL